MTDSFYDRQRQNLERIERQRYQEEQDLLFEDDEFFNEDFQIDTNNQIDMVQWQKDNIPDPLPHEIRGQELETDHYDYPPKQLETPSMETKNDNQDLVPISLPVSIESLPLAAAKTRLENLRSYIQSALTDGIDFGTIPGCGDKPVLKKPGAEKILLFLQLRPKFIPITLTEDFQSGLFFYRYECELYHIPSGQKVGSGIGSCNSRESKYRWRKAERLCPKCHQPTIRKSKWADKDPDKAWYCYAKLGGCSAQFKENDTEIINQDIGRIENPDIADQVNTIDKMAQKRSLLAAILVFAGVSEYFTQDLEDFIEAPQEAHEIRSTTNRIDSIKQDGTTSPIVHNEAVKSDPREEDNLQEIDLERTPVEMMTDSTRLMTDSTRRTELKKVIDEICQVSGKDREYTFKRALADHASPMEFEDLQILGSQDLQNTLLRAYKILNQVKRKTQKE